MYLFEEEVDDEKEVVGGQGDEEFVEAPIFPLLLQNDHSHDVAQKAENGQ